MILAALIAGAVSSNFTGHGVAVKPAFSAIRSREALAVDLPGKVP